MTAFNFEMMAALLRETEQQHALVEKQLPKHEWQDWYGAFMVSRMQGEQVTREIAADLASDYIRLVSMGKNVSATVSGVTIVDG